VGEFPAKLPESQAVAGSTVAVVFPVNAAQPLHLLHYLYRILLNEGLRRKTLR
jgi:hypothetical protein